MKSEKAESIIRSGEWMDDETGERAVYVRRAYEALEVAEKEAEERMRAELTRWHDPKDVLPERYKPVEVKYLVYGVLCISIAWMALLKNDGYVWTINGTTFRINGANIIGWREIHENE